MYVFDYDGTPLSKLESDVEFREILQNEVEQTCGTEHLESTAGRAPEESGSIVGLMNGKIVYRASYVRADPCRLNGAPSGWSPRGRVLFLHAGSTEPEYRGRGIHSAATRWLMTNERGPGVAHAVCVVHADNFAARRTVERAGFRQLGPVDE